MVGWPCWATLYAFAPSKAEADAIKREVNLLRQLVDKYHAMRDHEQENEQGDFDAGSDDDLIKVQIIVLHDLKVEEEDEDQILRQEHQHEGEEDEE